MNIFKATASVILFVGLIGCAGTSFKWNDARQIKQGMSTKEVSQLMGRPYSVTSRDGILIYVWAYTGFGMATRTLRVDFKDDKAIVAPVIPDTFQD